MGGHGGQLDIGSTSLSTLISNMSIQGFTFGICLAWIAKVRRTQSQDENQAPIWAASLRKQPEGWTFGKIFSSSEREESFGHWVTHHKGAQVKHSERLHDLCTGIFILLCGSSPSSALFVSLGHSILPVIFYTELWWWVDMILTFPALSLPSLWLCWGSCLADGQSLLNKCYFLPGCFCFC